MNLTKREEKNKPEKQGEKSELNRKSHQEQQHAKKDKHTKRVERKLESATDKRNAFVAVISKVIKNCDKK